VVLMTHSYEQDRTLLAGLLGADGAPGVMAGYIGLLGARHRSSLLVSEAATMLGRSVAECCERVYAPMGLDLGGDGAEAIALAVVAEVQAWVQGRLARSRRLTAQDVAEQIAQGGASRYQQAQCALGAAGT
jgi:xanthine/CO dehydrogenase XdhC/CoxF family maturation factor